MRQPHHNSQALRATLSHAGTGEKCGRFDWVVPANVKPGQYQVIVTSLAHPDKYVGYTDTVVVKKAKSTAKAKGKAKRHDVQRLE